MNLILVQTPAIAKRLYDLLDDGWRVEVVGGGLRQLAPLTPRMVLAPAFNPLAPDRWRLRPRAGNRVRRLIKQIARAERVYLALPPTPDGDLTAWHLLELARAMRRSERPILRVLLDALTHDGLRVALANAQVLNLQPVEAEIARLTADALLMQALAQLLTQFPTPLDAAGAALLVQLHAAHPHPVAYDVELQVRAGEHAYRCTVHRPDGKPLGIDTREGAEKLVQRLGESTVWVEKHGIRPAERPAPTPLLLPELLQYMEQHHQLLPARTLSLAHLLYEAGWITHPARAVAANGAATSEFIARTWGDPYVGDKPPVLSGIVPTDVNHILESEADGARVYRTVWVHTVAAYMAATRGMGWVALLRVGSAPGKSFPLQVRASGFTADLAGWQAALPETFNPSIPPLSTNQPLDLQDVQIVQRPPALTAAALMSTPDAAAVERRAGALEDLVRTGHVEILPGGVLRLSQTGEAWIAARHASPMAALFNREATQAREHALERTTIGEIGWRDALVPLAEAIAQAQHIQHQPVVFHPAHAPSAQSREG